jgi:tetrahydromethanopterin S-methyltransferase subunit G
MRSFLVVLILLQINGCATTSSSVVAASVSIEPYLKMDCQALMDERRRMETTAREVAQVQDKSAGSDAGVIAGTIIFGPIFMMGHSGNSGIAVELSRLKGEYEAIETVRKQKSC